MEQVSAVYSDQEAYMSPQKHKGQIMFDLLGDLYVRMASLACYCVFVACYRIIRSSITWAEAGTPMPTG